MRTKVLLLLAVCMAVVVGAEIPGAGVESGRGGSSAKTERTTDAAIGASIPHPDGWVIEREQVSYDGTRGFKLWKAEGGTERDHGGIPEVRVALAPDVQRGEIGQRVRETIRQYPDLRLTRETVKVSEKGLKGVAVGPIPGSTPYVEVYVPVEDRVYQINVYGTKLDDEAKRMLAGVRFAPPARGASSSVAQAPDAGDPATFYASDAKSEALRKQEEAHHKKQTSTEDPVTATRSASSTAEPTRSASAVPAYGEYRINEGCWRADSRFFVQTQNGYMSNREAGDGIATGYTRIGDQVGSYYGNFWGQYTHGNYGYGRCTSPYYVNDYYALDYPLNSGKTAANYASGIGDVVFSPFNGGTVTFAGRNQSHANYGIFVTIRADNGKYVNISAHLSALATGIRPGKRVTKDTVIGYAGDTGAPSIPVGTAHLHQGFYRYPSFRPDGSPYGGQGLQVIYHHYTGIGRGVPAGVYQFAWPASDTAATRTKGEPVGN